MISVFICNNISIIVKDDGALSVPVFLLLMVGVVVVGAIISGLVGAVASGVDKSKPLEKKALSKEGRRIKTLYFENDIICLSDKMPWGKYKGHTVSSLPSSYFNWLTSKAIDITYYAENEPFISKNPDDRHYGKSYTYGGKPIRMIEDED
jgi:hypothetical protein